MRVHTMTMAVCTVLLLAGSTTACADDSATRERIAPALSESPDTLVLRVQELRSGPAPWEQGRLPTFSLYGGGRVVVPGPSAGALQQAREFHLPAEEFGSLLTSAVVAGLYQAHTYEDTDTVDATLLLVSLRANDDMRTTRVTEPEAHRSGPEGRVVAYVERLPGVPDGARVFQPTTLAVLATGGVSEGPTAAVPWPLRPLGDGTRTREGMCTLVTGDALTDVSRLAANASQETRWSSGGKLYAVSFRPLLPDEHTCQDVDTW
ncbi:hypothetical protein [Actinophytocola sp.]|uniref:hypothetical protein n=1 Tax=Actinophytocola sp. TaxID=1872138 RepID=UPI002ED5FF76